MLYRGFGTALLHEGLTLEPREPAAVRCSRSRCRAALGAHADSKDECTYGSLTECLVLCDLWRAGVHLLLERLDVLDLCGVGRPLLVGCAGVARMSVRQSGVVRRAGAARGRGRGDGGGRGRTEGGRGEGGGCECECVCPHRVCGSMNE